MTHFGRSTIPGNTRGILPLLIAAMAAGAGRGLLGGITANQTKQRNKGYINASYRRASQELETNQAYSREEGAESANARGLAQAGGVNASPIHTAMLNGVMKATGDVTNTVRATPFTKGSSTTQHLGAGPTTLGGQDQTNAGIQMGLERQDLDQQHDRALKDNKTDYLNGLLGSAVAGVQTAASVYTSGKELSPPTRSSVHAAMLSGSSFDGVHPNDPLGEPTSAWSTHPRPLLADPSQTNASFNVG